MDVLRTLGIRRTPQSERADARQHGTYYAAPRDLARENAEIVTRMVQEDPETLVSTIVEVSRSGDCRVIELIL